MTRNGHHIEIDTRELRELRKLCASLQDRLRSVYRSKVELEETLAAERMVSAVEKANWWRRG